MHEYVWKGEGVSFIASVLVCVFVFVCVCVSEGVCVSGNQA
jgi:hypothetical protein